MRGVPTGGETVGVRAGGLGEGGGGELVTRGVGGIGTGEGETGPPVRHWQTLAYPGAGSRPPKEDLWQANVPETGYQSLQRLQVG